MLCVNVDKRLRNVIMLGVCFMMLFAADYTVTNMQKTIISSIHDEKPEFTVDGYTSLGITYMVFALSLWLGPSMISMIGPRYGMSLAAVAYSVYILAFNLEESWAIYAVTVIGGVGGGLLWTAEGNYLVLNSDSKTISRNVGIFWAFLQSSSLFGNMFTYYKFEGKKRIDRETRHQVIYVLGGIAALSVFAFLLLRENRSNKQKKNEKPDGPVEALRKTWSVFTTREMLILNLTFCYTGLQHAFTYGVYSPSVGFTNAFGNKAKQLVALSGMCIAIGEVIGGMCQMTIGKCLSQLKFGRSTVIIVGFLIQTTAFTLIYLNLPNSAVFSETDEKALITSNDVIAMVCSVMLGFADSCLNTQNFSIIAVIYPENSAQTCALYKFIKSFFVAIGFYTSPYLGLHYQLGILIPAALVGAIAFCWVDKGVTRTTWQVEESEEDDDELHNNL